MGTVLLGIFIGATVIYYLSNRIFRHGLNCILLFFFRIPVKLLEFIDSHTCQTNLNTPTNTPYEWSVSDTKIGYSHNTIEPETVTQKPVEPKQQKTFKQNTKSFRTPDGKQVFQMDDDSLINEWLSKNPDLKVER